jgi:hypothetical protein
MPNTVLFHMNEGFSAKKLAVYQDKPNTYKIHNSLFTN